MKKQLSILFLSSAVLAGCHCNQPAATCDLTPIIGRCHRAEATMPSENDLVLGALANFATDSAVLSSKDKSELDNIVTALKQHEGKDIRVNGYTDSTGSAAHNQGLSQRRADSVKNYLVSKGIAEHRIATKGYGASHYIATNATKEGRAQNRRAEIVCDK